MAEILEFRNCIGGEMRPPASGKYMDQINPSTGEVWARVPASNKADVDAAVDAAKAAFPMWSGLQAPIRAFILNRVAELFKQHHEELTMLEMKGTGVLPIISEMNIVQSLFFVWERAAAVTLEAVTGRSVPLDANTMGYTRREPFGVVAGIIPFNSPLPMAAHKAALALAAGNTVVIKPPDQCSPSILRFAELLTQYLPPGCVNFVSGTGAEVGEALVRNPAVRRISMTGSPGAARKIQAAAAENLTSAIFELGGKSPNIVLDDADLDRAAIGVTKKAIFTSNAGQACVGGSRILIQRPVFEEMLKRIEAIAKTIKLGDPFEADTTMGPLISQAQFDKVINYIELGKKTTKLVFGGRSGAQLVPSRPGGYWVEPTLFTTTDNSLRICQEEIFGPVTVAIPFDTEEEAIAIANDSRYGLAAGVWTRDLGRAHRFVRDLKTGNVWVNSYMETRYELPFGGIMDSGYGHDHVLEFTHEKTAVIAT